jgi:hypothetical protein
MNFLRIYINIDFKQSVSTYTTPESLQEAQNNLALVLLS